MTARDRVAAIVDDVRRAAIAEFGWTHLELVATDADDGRVRLHGSVVARGLLEQVRRACAHVAELDDRGVLGMHTGCFVAVPAEGRTVVRRPDRTDVIATELDAGDGPVEVLATHGEATLVRVGDGTVGWIHASLGPSTEAPRHEACRHADLAALGRVWSTWIDVPYRLGGTRPTGVDCSGLVQRLLASAGLRVPRHSRDQLAVGPHAGPSVGVGDVLAIWSADESPCHVGLVIDGSQVVQASRSRSRVVVESVAEFIATARRVAHVPLADVLALQQRAHGRHDLLAALPDRD